MKTALIMNYRFRCSLSGYYTPNMSNSVVSAEQAASEAVSNLVPGMLIESALFGEPDIARI